jgi:iron complex outermembrane receptor protein
LIFCLIFQPTARAGDVDSPDPAEGGEEGDITDEFAFLEEELHIDEVMSASRHRQPILWSPSTISLITREDIRSSGATSLVDLLRRVPGFDVYELKPAFPLVGARALTDDSNNLVLLLVDGREALVELAGFPLWAMLSFDIEEIERIEVIRGPGSTMYGANAFAAVVSVTTVSETEGLRGDTYLSGGETGHLRLFGRVRGASRLGGGIISFSAGLGTEGINSPSSRMVDAKSIPLRSHGYVRYREGDSLDVSLHAGYMQGNGIMYMHVGDLIGTDMLDHNVLGQAAVELSEHIRLKTQLYHTRFYSKYHYRFGIRGYGVWVGDVPDFFIDTNTIDGQAQVDIQILKSLLVIGGANLRYTTMASDNVIPRDITETRGAGFLHLQWEPTENVQLTGGLRADFNSETGLVLSPRGAVVFLPDPHQSVRLGYGLAFRKPSFVESRMHFKMSNFNPAFPEVVDKLAEQFGNENLDSERVHSFEVSWRARIPRYKLELCLDLYYNLYRDTVKFKMEMPLRMGVPDIPGSTIQFVNEGTEANALGTEMSLNWEFVGGLFIWANLGLRMVYDNEAGKRLSSEPLVRANLGFRIDPGEGPFIDLALHYVSRYEMNLMNANDPFEGGKPIEAGDAALLIGRLGYRLKEAGYHSLEAGVTFRSPLGHDFREFPGVPVSSLPETGTNSDFGGEMLVRLLALYVRGSF